MTTAEGGAIPLAMRMVKEKGGWKIAFIEVEQSGLSVAGNPASMAGAASPGVLEPNTEMQAFVLNDTRRFVSSLGDGNFASFLPRWHSAMTESELEPLAAGREKRDLIAAITAQPPKITTAEMTQEGWLELEGFFENDRGRYEFAYAYANDGGRPKLVNFNYEVFSRQ